MINNITKAMIIIISFSYVMLLSLNCYSDPWEFNIKNDFVIPGGLDRYLSNEFYYKQNSWKVSNSMWTPTKKSNDQIPFGDRPWDGYTYIEKEFSTRYGFGEYLKTQVRFGLVGEWSGSEALQKFIHDDLNAGDHPTWEGQNPSEPTIDILLFRETKEYMQSIVGNSQVRNQYGIQFGTVKDTFFIDQELRKHFFKYLYPYVGLRGEAVLYNTHLDGRLFQKNKHTEDKEWFVSTARFGFELYHPGSDWFMDYRYEYITQEFVGQPYRHAYGSLSFGKRF